MKSSYFSSDSREFLGLLYKFDVKYLIVGGEAVIYYGYPRLTGDIDFFYAADSKNTALLYEALLEFWDNDIPGLNDFEELQSQGYIIQFGVPPNRIDLLNSIDGVAFIDAWKNKKTEYIEVNGQSIPVYYIGLKDLIINKRESGRSKDKEDLNYLEEI